MRLVELAPRFVCYAVVDGVGTVTKALSLEFAHGVEFRCPNGRGRVQAWFLDRAPASAPGLRWQVVGGRGLEDLSLHPSVDAGGACGHVWIQAGEVRSA